MGAKQGITAPIYKIDADAAIEFFDGDVDLSDIPALLVSQYNSDKGTETYRLFAVEGVVRGRDGPQVGVEVFR